MSFFIFFLFCLFKNCFGPEETVCLTLLWHYSLLQSNINPILWNKMGWIRYRQSDLGRHGDRAAIVVSHLQEMGQWCMRVKSKWILGSESTVNPGNGGFTLGLLTNHSSGVTEALAWCGLVRKALRKHKALWVAKNSDLHPINDLP